MLNDARSVLLDLLLDLDGSAIIDEVEGLKRKGFGDSHSGGREQNIQGLFLIAAPLNEFRNRVCFERWTFLLRMLHNREVHRFGIPDSLVNRFAVRTFQRRHDLLDELDVLVNGSW